MKNNISSQELQEKYKNLPLIGEGECKIERLCNMLSPAMTLAEIMEDNTTITEELRVELHKQFITSMKHVKAILDSITHQ